MTRGLSKEFLSDLTTGFLSPLRDRVCADKSLCLELRDDYLNVYYRGGNLVRLARSTKGYIASFDTKYFGGGSASSAPAPLVQQPRGLAAWLDAVPLMKQAMDVFPKEPAEREVQQLIVRDNNFGAVSRSTDFYICDIEYASDHGRFDIVAVRWPSTPAVRKKQDSHRLVLGEVKYGDGALDGTAGLHAHVRDVNNYLAKPESLATLKGEMVRVFNQKRALGLIDCEKDLLGFSDELPLLLLVLVNHDPDKSRLRELLRSLPPSPYAELRVATGCGNMTAGTTMGAGFDLRDVGRRVKSVRCSRGLSLSQVATSAALPEMQLQRIEDGLVDNVDLESLDQLAHALAVPILQLFPERHVAVGADDRAGSPDEQWARLPGSLRNFVEQERAAGRGVHDDVLRSLADITFEGKYPDAPDTWRILYRAFIRALYPNR